MEFELKNVEATIRRIMGFQKGLHSVMAAKGEKKESVIKRPNAYKQM